MRARPFWRDAVIAFCLPLTLTCGSHLIQGDIGLNLSDEGFLWYGTIQTIEGNVPIRDFQAYDPGRYYWDAAWSHVFGNGILGLRLSGAIFQCIGLALGLLAARRAVHSWPQLLFAGIILTAWMYPRHKIFEPVLSMAAVYVAVLLLEYPSVARHFLAGTFVGLAAFFGRNHGAYNFLAFLLLIVLLNRPLQRASVFPKHVMAWVAGIVVGYSPLIGMLIFEPDFFASFLASVQSTLLQGAGNLSIPVPWPWRINYSTLDLLSAASQFIAGIAFMLFGAYYLLSIGLVLSFKLSDLKPKALFVASTVVGFFYMHHAYGRADISHLAQSFHPFLLGLLALPIAVKTKNRAHLKVAILALISVLSLPVLLQSPLAHRLRYPDIFRQYEIHDETIWVTNDQKDLIESVRTLAAHDIRKDEGILIAPHWPGLYCIIEKPSPIWRIYFLFPEEESKQTETIAVLRHKNVAWAILGDVGLDDRDDRRFPNTHAFIWQYFMSEYDPIEMKGLPPSHRLLRRKDRTTPIDPAYTRRIGL